MKITRKQFDSFPVVNCVRRCPTGDYRGISTFSGRSDFGPYSRFRAKTVFQSTNFGRAAVFGEGCTFLNCTFGDNTRFGKNSVFQHSKFGNECVFGPICHFSHCDYGNNMVFGERCVFDNHVAKPGYPLFAVSTMFYVLRTVYVFNTIDGLYVQAGCFFGTADEFLQKTAEDCNDRSMHINPVYTKKKMIGYPEIVNLAKKMFDITEQTVEQLELKL